MKTESRYFFFCLLIIFQLTAFSQEIEEKPRFIDRLSLGGDFSIRFGSVTSLAISPELTFKLNNIISPGVGVTYQYYHLIDFDFSTRIYGYKAFSFLSILQPFFGVVELDRLNLSYFVEEYDPFTKTYSYYESGRFWNTALFVGAGVNLKFGSRGGSRISILYDLNHSSKSPYSNPLFRFGFYF